MSSHADERRTDNLCFRTLFLSGSCENHVVRSRFFDRHCGRASSHTACTVTKSGVMAISQDRLQQTEVFVQKVQDVTGYNVYTTWKRWRGSARIFGKACAVAMASCCMTVSLKVLDLAFSTVLDDTILSDKDFLDDLFFRFSFKFLLEFLQPPLQRCVMFVSV